MSQIQLLAPLRLVLDMYIEATMGGVIWALLIGRASHASDYLPGGLVHGSGTLLRVFSQQGVGSSLVRFTDVLERAWAFLPMCRRWTVRSEREKWREETHRENSQKLTSELLWKAMSQDRQLDLNSNSSSSMPSSVTGRC